MLVVQLLQYIVAPGEQGIDAYIQRRALLHGFSDREDVLIGIAGAHLLHQPFRQFGLYRQRQILDLHGLYGGQPVLFPRLQHRFQLAQVVAAESDHVRERHAPRCSFTSAGMLQQHAVAQHAEHGCGDQFAFVGTDALILEEIAQCGVGGMCQGQDGTQCLDDDF